MDWTQFKQTLCDDLRPNALDAMNPYVTINAVMPMVEYQAAEIDRLKAELELRTRERDQYDSISDLRTSGDLIVNIVGNQVGEEERQPELYAHLAGRGE